MSDANKDQVSGRVKEAVGVLIDDNELKDEGKLEQIAGDLKEKAGKAIDRVKEAVTPKED